MCVCVCVCVCVHTHARAKSCLTLCNPMDCRPLGFSVYGIFQARLLEWVAISKVATPEDLPHPRIETRSLESSTLAAKFFTIVQPRKLQNGVVIIPYKIMVQMTYFGKSLQTINQIKPVVGLASWLEEWWAGGTDTRLWGLLCLRAYTTLGLLRPSVSEICFLFLCRDMQKVAAAWNPLWQWEIKINCHTGGN